MTYEQILSAVAEELQLPVSLVNTTYKAYWQFVKDIIQELPLKDDINEQQFSQLRTNINVPSLGKLTCTRDRYLGVKKRFNYINNLKSNND